MSKIPPKLVEVAARAVEYWICSPFEWTEEQFETWFNKDPFFTKNKTGWGFFDGTRKGKLLEETKIALEAYEAAKERDPEAQRLSRAIKKYIVDKEEARYWGGPTIEPLFPLNDADLLKLAKILDNA